MFLAFFCWSCAGLTESKLIKKKHGNFYVRNGCNIWCKSQQFYIFQSTMYGDDDDEDDDDYDDDDEYDLSTARWK